MTEKQLAWKNRLETWRESDMSMAAWCRQEDIDIHQMYYWTRRYDRYHSINSKATSQEWLSLSNDSNDDQEAAILTRLDHLSVEIKPHVDLQLLSDLIWMGYTKLDSFVEVG